MLDDHAHIINKGFQFKELGVHHVIALKRLKAQGPHLVPEVGKLSVSS